MSAVFEVIAQAADFSRVLNAPCRARTAHFAVHYLAKPPGTKPPANAGVPGVQQSGDAAPINATLAHDETEPTGVWLGLVVPKRHARKAVTRSLLKRRIRNAFSAKPDWARGMWVVRLRTSFARTEFTSAASDKLSVAVTDELSVLMTAAARALR